jgi:hypothetical protein
VWPNPLDILATLVATAAMAVAVLPLRAQTPGLTMLAAQIGIAVVVYGALAYLLDIGKLRMKIDGMVRSHA